VELGELGFVESCGLFVAGIFCGLKSDVIALFVNLDNGTVPLCNEGIDAPWQFTVNGANCAGLFSAV